MKALYQTYSDGNVVLAQVPAPVIAGRSLLVANRASAISIGTERSVLEMGRRNLLGKLKARPDLLKRAIEKGRQEGFLKAWHEGKNKLDEAVVLGYSCAGSVIATGPEVREFAVGDAVACYGAGIASHAELIVVPELMAVPLPRRADGTLLDWESASFGMIGAIPLHGFRLAKTTLGDNVGIIGLGLLGLIGVQLARSISATAIGLDKSIERAGLARSLGASFSTTHDDAFEQRALELTQGKGLDAVLICTAGAPAEVLELAIRCARVRARIVIVGVLDVTVPRQLLWEKEVQLLVSRAAGPGFLDAEFEKRSHDYPLEYVRWTERRNVAAFLQLIADGRVDVQPLITKRFTIDDAQRGYEELLGEAGRKVIGAVFTYPSAPTEPPPNTPKIVAPLHPRSSSERVGAAVIGCGSFARALFLPALAKNGKFDLRWLVARNSATASRPADRYQFGKLTTHVEDALDDPAVEAVFILTRHDAHAPLVRQAIAAGKSVFVEKPLCQTVEGLEEIRLALGEKQSLLRVGYNRRYARLVQEMQAQLRLRSGPALVTCRANVGPLPADHWVNDEVEGGGRFISEGCHFLDLAYYLVGRRPISVTTIGVQGANRSSYENVTASVRFADGSAATVIYSGLGDRSPDRERIEAWSEGRTLYLTDLRSLEWCSKGRRRTKRLMNQDAGYEQEIASFAEALRHPEAFADSNASFLESTALLLAAMKSLCTGVSVDV